jgi:nicotinate-nucleotide pyrophosphorylase (carboxylating)
MKGCATVCDIISLALEEDIGRGDVTSSGFIDPAARSVARIVAREPCVLAGIGVAGEVFRRLDGKAEVSFGARDGDRLEAGATALRIVGNTRAILTAERTALNFVQRLSGIATLARAHVDAVAGTGVTILDTRKTSPGMRALEKAAVAAGGASNHRMGLDDMVMVKDNHLAACGGLSGLPARIAAIRKTHPGIPVVVEVDSPDQLPAVLAIEGINRILLDNMSPDELRAAAAMRRPGVTLEASGGITLSNIRETALTGVDFISVGAMTHSARAMDFGLDFEDKPDASP